MKILIILLCLLTLTGCKEETSKEVEEKNEPVISYYNCVGKKDNEKRIFKFEFEDNKLERLNFEFELEWGNIYGGGTDQIYEIAKNEVKKDFDSELSGTTYEYIFNNEGTAIAKGKITRKQVESKEITNIDGTPMEEIFKSTREQIMVKYNIGDYCTTNNEENWDIVIFDPLYEYTDIYLDYIDESAKSYGDVMYSWYILTTDSKVMNVVYMVDYDGLTYAYDDYQAPTLEEAKKNAKEDKINNVFNKEEYIKWLESLEG